MKDGGLRLGLRRSCNKLPGFGRGRLGSRGHCLGIYAGMVNN